MKPDNTQETIYVGLDTGLPPYLPYPRFLLKMDISQTAKLLYALLLDRTTLSQRNGWQDDQGRTFIVYPIAEIAEMLEMCIRDSIHAVVLMEPVGKAVQVRIEH